MSCSVVVAVWSQGNGSPILVVWCWLHCGHARTGAEALPPSPQSGWAAVFFGPRSSAAIPPSSETSPKKLRGEMDAPFAGIGTGDAGSLLERQARIGHVTGVGLVWGWLSAKC